jgi:lipopolysaccharide export system protein LptC
MAMSTAQLLSPVHRRLLRRNRLVGLLRLAVPALGAVVLLALLVQIVLSSFGGRFSVGQITISPDAVTVEAPDYIGVLQDGSAYRVSAISARAAATRPDLIDLAEAKLVLDRIDGVQLTADASTAQLDTTGQLTIIPGVADVADSTGTTGTLRNSVFDWQAQLLTTKGAVAIDYADGTSVRATGLVYDAATMIWTFERSVVTLPSTPGEDEASDGDETP